MLSERLALYRVSAIFKRSSIAFSAKVKSPSRLQLAERVSIQEGTILHCGGKVWSGYGGYLRLGAGVNVGPYCIIYAAGGVEIDAFAHLGPGVKVMSQAGKHDRARLSHVPSHVLGDVKVGAGSWVGAGAVLLSGCVLGRCVSVAPNSVVSGVFPDFSVVSGNPARVVLRNEGWTT